MTSRSRPRASTWPPGSLVDVEGLRVGHHTKIGRHWRTGTTVVICPPGTRGGVDVRGGAPGTRETELLRPDTMMDRVDGICLSGGSAFGLRAADGVMAVLEERGVGFPVGQEAGWVVPIVPAAVIFDLGRGGRFDHRPDAEFGERAARAARRSAPAQGAVGAGAGARSGGIQGGVGSASVRVAEFTVSALAVVNSVGTVIDPATALPWFMDHLPIAQPTKTDHNRFRRHYDEFSHPLSSAVSSLNTTVGVIATDADLTKAECQKLSGVAHDGLARAIRPAHSMNDGDTIFALATQRLPLGDSTASPRGSFLDSSARLARLNLLLEAGATAFSLACTLAVLRANGCPDRPGYRDLVPSALRSLPED